jgi:DNA primase
MSAIKMATHMHSVALLGTNLSEAKVSEILEGDYEHIFLCLDNDAIPEAIRLQITWRAKIPQMQLVALPKDIKDMDDDEFKKFLTRLK